MLCSRREILLNNANDFLVIHQTFALWSSRASSHMYFFFSAELNYTNASKDLVSIIIY